jgi:hypothetical protein
VAQDVIAIPLSSISAVMSRSLSAAAITVRRLSDEQRDRAMDRRQGVAADPDLSHTSPAMTSLEAAVQAAHGSVVAAADVDVAEQHLELLLFDAELEEAVAAQAGAGVGHGPAACSSVSSETCAAARLDQDLERPRRPTTPARPSSSRTTCTRPPAQG